MSNLYFISDYKKGAGAMVCKECGGDGEPVEKTKTAIVCGECQHPFNYFQNSEYFNKKKEQRLKEDRAAANKKVKRSHRL